MTIFREEPPITEADTKPMKHKQLALNLHGLDVAFMENKATPHKRLAVLRGVAFYVLLFHGWREITQQEYEANLP